MRLGCAGASSCGNGCPEAPTCIHTYIRICTCVCTCTRTRICTRDRVSFWLSALCEVLCTRDRNRGIMGKALGGYPVPRASEFHPHNTVVKSNAKQPERENGIPKLKSLALLTSVSGTLVGHDYRGRHVQMTPLAQFKGDSQSGSWTLHAALQRG